MSDAFRVGDRVVLQGLSKAPHLNGRHGHIGFKPCEDPERLPVHLDLLDPHQPKLAVKPQNLRREGRIIRYVDDKDDTNIAEPQNANVSNGCIEESYGRPLCLLLDTLRYLSAKELVGDKSIQSIHDIEQMHGGRNGSSDKGMAAITQMNYFLAVAWSHWSDLGEESMYEIAKKWITEWEREFKRTPIPVDPREANDIMRYRNMISFGVAAFDHVRAVKSWHMRIHGDFWIVGGDTNGSYLIPKRNEDMVYQCVGLTTCLHEAFQSRYGHKPMVCKVTLVPFYGRLVYDGTVALGGGDGSSQGLAMVASESKTRRLKATVEEAKYNNRVIRQLLQLEVEGGSLDGLPSYSQVNKSNVQTEQPQPTPLEVKLLRSYVSIPRVIPEDDRNGVWVFRRKGYTEQENPEHAGLILVGGGNVVGFFDCSNGLIPTSVDILSSVLEATMASGSRPHTLMPDDFSCFQRLKYLFAQLLPPNQIEETKIGYYHPPTSEETAAAMMTSETERKAAAAPPTNHPGARR
ncbi:hypothetical protein IV203_025782 [Nitzschia inconspicua]|uniref:Uncharacterized protein n=1 Tax=Nitzschia inconspicua TaxID=303405 RepID=A0A9K3LJG5_9STRA|nr:hypothetical protein IV203_025782 [Nitzschia inconspicua]